MGVTTASLKRIEQHWAIQAIGKEDVKRAAKLSNRTHLKAAVGDPIHFNYEFSQSDYDLLSRVAMAYEMAAIEELNDFLNPISSEPKIREKCASGAYKAFEIRRLLKVPEADSQRIFHILHISSLACCGGRWTDLQRWYNENEHRLEAPSVANAPWDVRLFNRLFECWIILFRKGRPDELDRICEIITGLREDQNQYENGVLNDSSNARNHTMALRLISMYHWAKATEILAGYIRQGESTKADNLPSKHFKSAIEAAATSGDCQLEILLRWLQIAGHQMIADFI